MASKPKVVNLVWISRDYDATDCFVWSMQPTRKPSNITGQWQGEEDPVLMLSCDCLKDTFNIDVPVGGCIPSALLTFPKKILKAIRDSGKEDIPIQLKCYKGRL